MLPLVAPTINSEKHIHVLSGDDLVLDCTLLNRLPKAALEWKFSGHHSRPLPARTIISRNQLILKDITEVLDPISYFANLGAVSWEEKFNTNTLTTREKDEVPRRYQTQLHP